MAVRDQLLGTYGLNEYAAGRKRYAGGGSFSATSGPVDPTGYINRDARNRARANAYRLALRDRQRGAVNNGNMGKIGWA